MTCINSLKFKKIQHYGDPTLMHQLETNTKHWLDWAFLSIGAWDEISIDSSGIQGGSFSELLPLHDNNYPEGSVYYSIRKDWIYETGVNYCSPAQDINDIYLDDDLRGVVQLQPYEYSAYESGDTIYIESSDITGLYEVEERRTNTSFYISDLSGVSISLLTEEDEFILLENDGYLWLEDSSGIYSTGGTVYGIYDPMLPTIYLDGVPATSGYDIDYPNGKVYFDSPVTGVDVSASYSHRVVQTYLGDDASWAFELQYDSFDPTNTSWEQSAESGEYFGDPSKRTQLPAIIIESAPNKRLKGYELGSSAFVMKQDITLTVVSENSTEYKLITDILSEQKEKKINLFDIDIVNKKQQMPLTYEGFLNPSGLQYPELVDSSVWAQAYISDTAVSKIETHHPRLHMAKVKWEVEVIK